MISTTFKATSSRFDQFAEDLAAGLQPKHQQMIYDGLALKFVELVTAHGETGTPVDTGRARAGWARALEELGGVFRLLGTDEANAIAEGRAKGRTGTTQKRHAAARWIVNGVDYIIWLEYGTSDQAPAGMIRINLERLRGEYREDAAKALRERLEKANAKARTTGLKWKVSS